MSGSNRPGSSIGAAAERWSRPLRANGNGRTARVWAAWIALRYGPPVFVTVKPRPNDAAYAQAAFASMGTPPHFTGDHSVAANVFSHLLSLALMP